MGCRGVHNRSFGRECRLRERVAHPVFRGVLCVYRGLCVILWTGDVARDCRDVPGRSPWKGAWNGPGEGSEVHVVPDNGCKMSMGKRGCDPPRKRPCRRLVECFSGDGLKRLFHWGSETIPTIGDWAISSNRYVNSVSAIFTAEPSTAAQL